MEVIFRVVVRISYAARRDTGSRSRGGCWPQLQRRAPFSECLIG